MQRQLQLIILGHIWVAQLTRRGMADLELLAARARGRQTAGRLPLSGKTVRSHISAILGTHTLTPER